MKLLFKVVPMNHRNQTVYLIHKVRNYCERKRHLQYKEKKQNEKSIPKHYQSKIKLGQKIMY